MTELNEVGVMSVKPDGFFTTSEVARKVGRSADTIRRWRKTQALTPSGFMFVGETKMKVHLYSEDDVEKARTYSATVRPGRPRKGTQG